MQTHAITHQKTISDTETFVQLTILQNAIRSILDSEEFREADPPFLDVLDVLTKRFDDLLKE